MFRLRTIHKPACQVGTARENAFTDRLCDLQWVDFAHGGSCPPSDEGAHPRQQEYGPAGEAVTVARPQY